MAPISIAINADFTTSNLAASLAYFANAGATLIPALNFAAPPTTASTRAAQATATAVPTFAAT